MRKLCGGIGGLAEGIPVGAENQGKQHGSKQQAVREVFLQILKDKPLRNISVTEICQRAGVHRTTFYKHYQDVYDLMDQTEQHLLAAFQREVGRMRTVDTEAALASLLTDMRDNIAQYAVLFSENGDPDLLRRLSELSFPLFRSNAQVGDGRALGDDLDKMVYSYISAGCAGILGYWMQYHFEQSPDTVAHLMMQMVRLTMTGIARTF